MSKLASIIATLGLIIAIGIIFTATKSEPVENSTIKDNIQYITINAKGGYDPQISTAQPNIPTKLIIQTNQTYDCSVALVIPDLNYQKLLSPSGTETIDLGTPKSGQKLQGTCSMGMYKFEINF